MLRHRAINPDFNKLSEEQMQFYSTLGILSVSFASMEYKIKELLSLLINPDEELIAVTMVEKLMLEMSLMKLEEINLIRSFHESRIKEIIAKIRNIKQERNLFIHGIWYTPYPFNGTVKVHCDNRRVFFDKKLHKDNPGEKHWKMNKLNEYTLPQLQENIMVINSIIGELEEIISEIINDSSCLNNY